MHRDFSAVTHVAANKGIPPFLILHISGNADTSAQARRLANVLQAAGISAKVVGRDMTHEALNEIRKLRGISIVVSEQVLSFALDVADRLFVIEGGRFVHETPRADADTAKIREYLSV